MIPGVATRLVKPLKLVNQSYLKLIAESINGLVDMLIIELRIKSKTSMDLVEALKPLFDYTKPFYMNNFQKVLEPSTANTSGGSAITHRIVQPKADLSSFTQ